MTATTVPTSSAIEAGAPDTPVLEAVDVTKHFEVRSAVGARSVVRAVEGASLALHRGRVVTLVGESGSGKTTLARLLAGFYTPTSGEIALEGVPVRQRRGRVERGYHKDVQIVFQDPFGSLNPLHRVRHNLERPLKLHHGVRGRAELDRRVRELLERVALTPTEQYVDKFPHELSGGQRQRVVIARALAVEPKVLLGDEPISMLDVSIRLEMLNLLDRLRTEDGLALLYITHDIASARYLCDDIVVMYAGEMVEGGPKEQVIADPQHPYTRLLVESSPDPGRGARDREALFDADADGLGEPPSLIDPPAGCRFHPRCPFAMDVCRTQAPPRADLGEGRWARCWLHAADRTTTQENE